MQLDKKALGLAMGILWGLAVLVMTVWAMFVGGGEHLILLGKFYLGYGVSPAGALIGLIWGFIDGFIGGWVLAWLYNKLAG
ncbi:MAG: bacteriophage holin [Thermoanaerobaculia bacterium]